MIPDWSAKAEPVPYAKLEDPQSLNLYGYVRNNPLSRNDPDGHCNIDGEQHHALWCFGHTLGITQTVAEEAKDARSQIEQMHGSQVNGKSPQDFIRGMNDAQVISANGKIANALMQYMTSQGSSEYAGVALYKVKKAGLSGKEASSEIPSWAEGEAPLLSENGKKFATRLLNEKYGAGNWKTGTSTEYSQLQKNGDRAWEAPPEPVLPPPEEELLKEE